MMLFNEMRATTSQVIGSGTHFIHCHRRIGAILRTKHTMAHAGTMAVFPKGGEM